MRALRGLGCPPGGCERRAGGSWAESEDGAAAAEPLRVVGRVHPVVGAVDVVDARLPLVPVTHLRERDQLDGLALRRQPAGGNLRALLRPLSCSLPPAGCSVCSGVGILAAICLSICASHDIPTETLSSGLSRTLWF